MHFNSGARTGGCNEGQLGDAGRSPTGPQWRPRAAGSSLSGGASWRGKSPGLQEPPSCEDQGPPCSTRARGFAARGELPPAQGARPLRRGLEELNTSIHGGETFHPPVWDLCHLCCTCQERESKRHGSHVQTPRAEATPAGGTEQTGPTWPCPNPAASEEEDAGAGVGRSCPASNAGARSAHDKRSVGCRGRRGQGRLGDNGGCLLCLSRVMGRGHSGNGDPTSAAPCRGAKPSRAGELQLLVPAASPHPRHPSARLSRSFGEERPEGLVQLAAALPRGRQGPARGRGLFPHPTRAARAGSAGSAWESWVC